MLIISYNVKKAAISSILNNIMKNHLKDINMEKK